MAIWDRKICCLIGCPIRISIDCCELPLCGRLLIADEYSGVLIIAKKVDKENCDVYPESSCGSLSEAVSLPRPSTDPKDYELFVAMGHAISSIMPDEYSDEDPTPLSKEGINRILGRYLHIQKLSELRRSPTTIEKVRADLFEWFRKNGIEASIAKNGVTFTAYGGFVEINPPYTENSVVSRNSVFLNDAISLIRRWREDQTFLDSPGEVPA